TTRSNTSFRRLHLPLYFISIMTSPPPTSTLFPYTTLFRSSTNYARVRKPVRPPHWSWPRRPHPNRNQRPRRTRNANRRQSGNRRSEEHTSELQSLRHLVCRLLLEKKKGRLSSRCFSYNALY